MTVGLQTAMKFGIIKELFQSGFIEIIMAAICFQRIYIYIYIYTYIQGDSRLVDITAGGDFLGLCDKKKVHINMCPILDGYGVMTA